MECVDTLTAMGLNEICNDFIEETKLYHRDPCIVHKVKKLSFRPRRLIPCAVAVGGFTGKENSTNRCVNFVGMCMTYIHKESESKISSLSLSLCRKWRQFKCFFLPRS